MTSMAFGVISYKNMPIRVETRTAADRGRRDNPRPLETSVATYVGGRLGRDLKTSSCSTTSKEFTKWDYSPGNDKPPPALLMIASDSKYSK